MGGSDWLMIYGDVNYSGNLVWLTTGVANISALRNAIALALAFPAVIFYAIALSNFGKVICNAKKCQTYHLLTLVGMTPWLCVHLFYIVIFFLFGYLNRIGMKAIAFDICEIIFNQFAFMVIMSEAMMVLPFIYIFYLIFTRQTVMIKPIYAFNNPIIIFIFLKLLVALMPNSAFRLAFTNGLMSEAMLVWFVILYFNLSKV